MLLNHGMPDQLTDVLYRFLIINIYVKLNTSEHQIRLQTTTSIDIASILTKFQASSSAASASGLDTFCMTPTNALLNRYFSGNPYQHGVEEKKGNLIIDGHS